MGLIPTLIIMAVALSIAVFARFRANRPHEPGGPPRIINWNIVMIIAGVVVVLMITHLISMTGVETGQGRGAYR